MTWYRSGHGLAATLLTAILALGSPAIGSAQEALGITPPRLSLIAGEVSFWRPGDEDWQPADLNLPLAEGDALATGADSRLELQIGPRDFARAGAHSQIRLEDLGENLLQIDVAGGMVALDLPGFAAGRPIELDTPGAAITPEQRGYYRVDTGQDSVTLVVRRGGRATVTTADGKVTDVNSDEEAIIDNSGGPRVATYAAPALDAWDTWNFDRTNRATASQSARYVPDNVYGASDLDGYGDWQAVPDYGSVWVPRDVSADWVPYSTGRWILDPYYGWTWIDDEPWGWAPFHYGRWVHFGHRWGWAPGPVVARAVYYPALVAFYGGPGVRVGIGVPFVSWVALSWGEPVIPWWGSSGFIGRPCWQGWGGPRVVNNVIINRTTVVNVDRIRFRNAQVPGSLVAVASDDFDRHRVERVRVEKIDARQLEPLHGRVPVQPRVDPRKLDEAQRRPPGAAAPPMTRARTRAPQRNQPAAASNPRVLRLPAERGGEAQGASAPGQEGAAQRREPPRPETPQGQVDRPREAGRASVPPPAPDERRGEVPAVLQRERVAPNRAERPPSVERNAPPPVHERAAPREPAPQVAPPPVRERPAQQERQVAPPPVRERPPVREQAAPPPVRERPVPAERSAPREAPRERPPRQVPAPPVMNAPAPSGSGSDNSGNSSGSNQGRSAHGR